MKTTLEVAKKYSKNSFGMTDLMVDYYFSTFDNSEKNTYIVTCIVRSLENGKIYLGSQSAELADHQEETNSSTLVESAVLDLFDETIS